MSSVAGKISATPQAPYSASKFALEALSEALAGELKPFNIRVVIVEPGIIQTPIFDKIKEASSEESIYVGGRRINALFATALENPVGPDAEGFLKWRASLSDEEWIDYGAQTDEEWIAYVKDTFEMDVAPHFYTTTR